METFFLFTESVPREDTEHSLVDVVVAIVIVIVVIVAIVVVVVGVVAQQRFVERAQQLTAVAQRRKERRTRFDRYCSDFVDFLGSVQRSNTAWLSEHDSADDCAH
jgi:type II secretory pathway pseudopilin PulG